MFSSDNHGQSDTIDMWLR